MKKKTTRNVIIALLVGCALGFGVHNISQQAFVGNWNWFSQKSDTCGEDKNGQCGGTCSDGAVCVDSDNGCVCDIPPPTCGMDEGGQCGGPCEIGACMYDSFYDDCVCSAGAICGVNVTDPSECYEGDCDHANKRCASDGNGGCGCVEVECGAHGDGPQCGGICPDGQLCLSNRGGSCKCQEPEVLCGGEGTAKVCGKLRCADATQTCKPHPSTGECGCVNTEPKCGLEGDQCGGWCPDDKSCVYDYFLEECECTHDKNTCNDLRQTDGDVCSEGFCPGPLDFCDPKDSRRCGCEPGCSADDFGMCGGRCRDGKQCTSTPEGCDCVDPRWTCEQQDATACTEGYCDDPTDVCMSDGETCSCQEAPSCDSSLDAKMCSLGDCPSGQTCKSDDGECSCVYITCEADEEAGGLCGGTCPNGESCVTVDGECSCSANACGTSSLGCAEGACPHPDESCDFIGDECQCHIPQPCNEAAADMCSVSTCPEGQHCTTNEADDGCICEDLCLIEGEYRPCDWMPGGGFF